MMEPIDIDNIARKMPAWSLRVTVDGQVCDICQPTLEQEEQLSRIESLNDADVFALFWSLLSEPRPAKSRMTRDTLVVVFSVLLRYRRIRYTPAMAAMVKPDEYTRAAEQLLRNVATTTAVAAAAGKLSN